MDSGGYPQNAGILVFSVLADVLLFNNTRQLPGKQIQNYLLPCGCLDPQAMILKGPTVLGMGPIIDDFIH